MDVEKRKAIEAAGWKVGRDARDFLGPCDLGINLGKTPGEDFPLKIQYLRSLLGLTQVKLAKELGVTFVTVNRWENGKCVPSPLAWEKLVKISTGVKGTR